MALRDLGAKELHCAKGVQHLRLDYGWAEAIAGEFVDDERAVGLRDRAEEAGGGIAHRLDRFGFGFEIEAEDVRDASVVGAAIEVAAIRREDETFRCRCAETECARWGRVAAHEIGDVEDLDVLFAAGFSDGGGKHRAVRRDV